MASQFRSRKSFHQLMPVAFGALFASIGTFNNKSFRNCDDDLTIKLNCDVSQRSSSVHLNLDEKIEKIFREHMDKEKIPGVTYAIVVDGKIMHQKCLGLKNISPSAVVDGNTRFRIASMTKSFTAMAITRLRDQHIISFSDPVGKYVPEFNSVKMLTRDSPIITIRDLLVMLGGLPQDDPWGDRLLDWDEKALESLVAGGLTFSNPPGISFEYSNLGYALLGLIISKVTKQPYQKYITEEILIPLGMHDTKFEYDAVPVDDLAVGYRWEENQWKSEQILHDGIFGAMGGLITTVEDFVKYVAYHQSAWPASDAINVNHNKPIISASLREMHQPGAILGLNSDEKTSEGLDNPRVLGYGYGLHWSLDKRGVTYLRHGGGLPGYGSEWRFLPHHGIGIVSFANRTYAPMSVANNKVMDLLLSSNGATSRGISPANHLQLVRMQLLEILASRFSDSASSSIFADNFFLDKPKHLWIHEVDEKFGTMLDSTSVSVSDVIPVNNLRGKFTVTCDGNSSLEIYFTMTPEQQPRVQSIELRRVQLPTAEIAPRF